MLCALPLQMSHSEQSYASGHGVAMGAMTRVERTRLVKNYKERITDPGSTCPSPVPWPVAHAEIGPARRADGLRGSRQPFDLTEACVGIDRGQEHRVGSLVVTRPKLQLHAVDVHNPVGVQCSNKTLASKVS